MTMVSAISAKATFGVKYSSPCLTTLPVPSSIWSCNQGLQSSGQGSVLDEWASPGWVGLNACLCLSLSLSFHVFAFAFVHARMCVRTYVYPSPEKSSLHPSECHSHNRALRNVSNVSFEQYLLVDMWCLWPLGGWVNVL